MHNGILSLFHHLDFLFRYNKFLLFILYIKNCLLYHLLKESKCHLELVIRYKSTTINLTKKY